MNWRTLFNKLNNIKWPFGEKKNDALNSFQKLRVSQSTHEMNAKIPSEWESQANDSIYTKGTVNEVEKVRWKKRAIEKAKYRKRERERGGEWEKAQFDSSSYQCLSCMWTARGEVRHEIKREEWWIVGVQDTEEKIQSEKAEGSSSNLIFHTASIHPTTIESM